MATTLCESCGTHMGLRLHQAAGERPCSACQRRELLASLEAERVPSRPSVPRSWVDDPLSTAVRRQVLLEAS